MGKKWISWVFALVALLTIGWTGLAASVAASQLTGNYLADGQALIASIRTAVSGQAESQDEAESAALDLIDAFSSRYHGDRFTKLQSYTTLRTIFNTVASSYRGSMKRPLKPTQVERVLSQLDKAEEALNRAG
jgi:photosystem II Psb27 protein